MNKEEAEMLAQMEVSMYSCSLCTAQARTKESLVDHLTEYHTSKECKEICDNLRADAESDNWSSEQR